MAFSLGIENEPRSRETTKQKAGSTVGNEERQARGIVLWQNAEDDAVLAWAAVRRI